MVGSLDSLPNGAHHVMVLDHADDLIKLGRHGVLDVLRLSSALQEATLRQKKIQWTLILVSQSASFARAATTFTSPREAIHFPYYPREALELILTSSIRGELGWGAQDGGGEPGRSIMELLIAQFLNLFISAVYQSSSNKHIAELKRLAGSLFLLYAKPVINGQGKKKTSVTEAFIQLLMDIVSCHF